MDEYLAKRVSEIEEEQLFCEKIKSGNIL